MRNPAILTVQRSDIQGKGLFTAKPLRKRQKLGELLGERISVRTGRQRAKTAKRIVIVELNDREAIDGSKHGGPFQYVNHACDANTFIRIAYGRVEFYTKRPIRAGEELTCDYGDSHHEGHLPCRCGAPRCRGFI